MIWWRAEAFSQAAAHNFITQSAVSQQVKGLELRFGRPLLDRQNRSVVPTDAGLVLYQAAREILGRYERMESDLKSAGQDIAGTIRVASIYRVGLYEMSPGIRTFLRTYPKVNLHVEYSRSNRVYEDCLRGAIDLGIVPYPKARKGIELSRCRPIDCSDLSSRASIRAPAPDRHSEAGRAEFRGI